MKERTIKSEYPLTKSDELGRQENNLVDLRVSIIISEVLKALCFIVLILLQLMLTEIWCHTCRGACFCFWK